MTFRYEGTNFAYVMVIMGLLLGTIFVYVAIKPEWFLLVCVSFIMFMFIGEK